MNLIESIIALCWDNPQLYSIVSLNTHPKLMYQYASREMATNHYKAIQSHGNAVALVWNGLIVRSCSANPRLKANRF